ncbi:MAG: rhomboid family intramembrane serine protease [Verrucomicrobiaceae bacterium]|nr:MAG: rhomboid family intramembrane serine protease [Verrucomicrobiaceae bacterium]
MTSSGAPFSNAARNLRQLGSSPVSWSAVAIVLAVQTVVSLAGGPNEPPAWGWFKAFGLSREGILSGKVWQIFTYGLLHGGWIHAAVNSVFVLLIGSRIEHMAGRLALVKTLVGGILGGGFAHLLLAPGGEGAPLLVGLSGGCLALLLLLTTLSPQSRMMPLPVSGRSLGFGILFAELVLALVDPDLGIPGFSALGEMLVNQGMGSWFDLGHACHFGGGLMGWVFGRWLLRPRITLKRLRRDRERREASESGRLG